VEELKLEPPAKFEAHKWVSWSKKFENFPWQANGFNKTILLRLKSASQHLSNVKKPPNKTASIIATRLNPIGPQPPMASYPLLLANHVVATGEFCHKQGLLRARSHPCGHLAFLDFLRLSSLGIPGFFESTGVYAGTMGGLARTSE
jgi:hypothetical protein